jgi:hypothetical protein
MKWIEELEHRKSPLSVKEAAKIYGDSTGTFYKKIRRGEVLGTFREPGKPRGRIKICPAEFAAWLRGLVAAGSQSANTKAMSPANAKNLSAEQVVASNTACVEDSVKKGTGKEVPRLAG